MKTIFKSKKVLIVLGIILSVAVIAGVTLAAFPTVAEKVNLRVYPRLQTEEKSNLTADEIREINESHLVQPDMSPLTEEELKVLEEKNKKADEIIDNQSATLVILEREYGSVENWAPDFDTRLELTIPHVQSLLEGNKLSDSDRATLEQFMNNIRDLGFIE